MGMNRLFISVTATSDIYSLSLHDALPISNAPMAAADEPVGEVSRFEAPTVEVAAAAPGAARVPAPRRRPVLTLRSEEHTSELQSQFHIVCRLLLAKKKVQAFVAASEATHL